MADGWARALHSAVRELPGRPVASAPRRARAPQPGAQQQPQRCRGRSEPWSTHRRAPCRLRLGPELCSLAHPQKAPTPRPGWTRRSPPRAPGRSVPARKASHARGQRTSQERRAGSHGAGSPSGVREPDRAQRNFSACGGRRGARSRRGGTARRGAEAGARLLARRGTRGHVTITRLQPPGRLPGESGAEIVGNSELHFPASAASSLRYVLGTIDQME